MDEYNILEHRSLAAISEVAAAVEQAAVQVHDLLSFVENEGNGFESEDASILLSIGNKVHAAAVEFDQYREALALRQRVDANSTRVALRHLTQRGDEAGAAHA